MGLGKNNFSFHFYDYNELTLIKYELLVGNKLVKKQVISIENSVLVKGLKFSICPKNRPKFDIIIVIEESANGHYLKVLKMGTAPPPVVAQGH